MSEQKRTDGYPFQVGRRASGLWLIRRGEGCYRGKAPFHPVVLCSRKHTARWEAGWTGDGSWVWTHEAGHWGSGWLLERWRGLDIDYGHVVRSGTLPDGTKMGFAHDHDAEPWTLLAGAVWWSDHAVPEWLVARGVVFAADDFSRRVIEEDLGTCLLPEREQERLRERRYG